MQEFLETLKEINLFVEEKRDFDSQYRSKTSAGSTLHGSIHRDKDHANKIWEHIKDSIDSSEKGQHISYRHEGTEEGGQEGSVEEMLHNKAQKYAEANGKTFISHSAEHADADFDDENSAVRKAMHEASDGNKHHVNAALYAFDVGAGKNGRGHAHNASLIDHEDSRTHLRKMGYTGSFDDPTHEHQKQLANLTFPRDTGAKPQHLSRMTDLINTHRQEGFLRNTRADEAKGHHSITVVGEGHLSEIGDRHRNIGLER